MKESETKDAKDKNKAVAALPFLAAIFSSTLKKSEVKTGVEKLEELKVEEIEVDKMSPREQRGKHRSKKSANPKQSLTHNENKHDYRDDEIL